MRLATLVFLAAAITGCGPSATAPTDGTSAGTFTVSIAVTGLAGMLVAQDNGGDDLTATADGTYTFARALADGEAYDVEVTSQPAAQSCPVTGGAGAIAGAGVTVAITCSDVAYRIGGDVSGLTGTLVLRDNGADDLTLTGDGPFFFATRLGPGAPYAITVATQPASGACKVNDGSGTVAGADVNSAQVLCAPTYAVGGMASGVHGTLVLQDNGGDDVTLTADGTFTFPTRLVGNAGYAVTIATAPTGQTCTVAGGSGTIAASDVTDVQVTCIDTHAVGGTVGGLLGGTLVLQNNGGDDLTITANGPFTFATALPDGASYAVTVAAQPAGQFCAVAGGSGMIAGADVTNVSVSCRRVAITLDEVYARPATGALGDTNGDGVRDAIADEFVEIVNAEAFAVDISGWVVKTGATPVTRFSFPADTQLAAGQRAVVFGGGTPTGSFGGAATFVALGASGLSLTDAPTSLTVELDTADAGGIALDQFTYTATTFGSSCTTTCASQVRSPAGSGAFVSHPTAAGNAGILWSPGVAATAAIPKLNPLASAPAANATLFSVLSPVTAQFNMAMDPATLDATHLLLYASPCATLGSQVTAFSSIGAGSDPAKASLVPSAALAFATAYCLVVDAQTSSAIDVPLAAAASLEFTTRPAASLPAQTIVISEVGGCRLSSTAGTTACGGTGANDEFVELYNPTAAAVDVSGWFVQRRSAGGSATCAATLPASTTIPAGAFYLVGGAGYTASHYANAAAADLVAAGSLVTGGSESVVLVASTGTCTGSSSIVDAVSYGTITDTLAALELPAMATFGDGTSIERKACFNSTADASTTGMLPGGGHETQGNSEHVGANNADWITRVAPGPQDAASPGETRTCP